VWTGYSGNTADAVRCWQDLCTDAAGILGTESRTVLNMRRNLAYWMLLADDLRNGLPFITTVTEEHQRVLGGSHLWTLASRVGLAHATGQAGDPKRALEIATAAAAGCRQHLSPTHEVTLNSRFEVALWTYLTGAKAEAITQFNTLAG